MFYVWLPLVFVLGAAVGSFINVCVRRLPYEKSLFWPSSRCGHCYQPIRWFHNLPLVSYWLLRGRCSVCGTPFSVLYFLVELFTGLAFAALFYFEVFRNALGIDVLALRHREIELGVIPAAGWVIFGYHAILLSFLIVVSLCDLEDMEIPLSVTITGAVVGLAGAALFPWPWPRATFVAPPMPFNLPYPPGKLPAGLYPWPVWYPLPHWLPAGSWQLGLATGLAGAVLGMVMLRAVRFLFTLGRGVEGLGVGDADLMMMAGTFIGWQLTLVAFFVAIVPALFFGIVQLLRKGDQALPFGPSLAVGVVLTIFLWPRIRGFFAPLFEPFLLAVLAVAAAVILLVTSFLLRLVRGGGAVSQQPS